MLGNRYLDFVNKSKGGKYTSASKADIERYDEIISDFQNNKFKRGSSFDVKKWADGFGGLSSDVVDFLSNVQDGDDILEGLANSMGKTTKAISSSGEEIQLTGNKFKDFFTKTKSSFGTFGKVVGNGLKGFGKALLGSGLNVLLNAGIGAALSLAFKLYDTVAHAQDNVIEKGKEASAAIKSNYDAISNSNQWKTSNLERFTELAKGVNESGLNMSLSSDEFAEYQSLASSLADTLPNLVVGFNSLGQPIIKAATDMEQLNQAFRDNDVEKYQENISKASDVIKGFKTQYDERGSLFKDTGAKQKQDIYKYILDSYKNLDVENLESWNRSIMDGLSEKGYNLFEIDDALGEIGVKKIDDKSIAKGIDKISEPYQKGQTELEQYASSVKETLPSFFMISDEYAKLVEKSPAIDTFIQSITSGLSSDYVNENFPTTESIEQWTSSITSALGNKKVQTSIEDLFQLNKDKDKMSFKEYEQGVNSLVDTISGSMPGITSDMMKASLGIDRELENMAAHYSKVSAKVGKEFADNLSGADLELASDIISEKDVRNAEELKRAMIETKQAAQDINANPIFDSIKMADENRNKGDDYLDALKYIEEAKEMYDKGLIGTDDFKARAKYLSPTGAEDPANFIENYSKATRYLTEDSTGVQNFLNDLEKKGYATFETLSDGTKQWSYNISDLESAAENMGMGFEFFMDMFGRLEDYGFSNNFFSTQEEGIEKISEKTAQLAKAKKELAEMETTGQYTTTDENGNQVQTEANQTAIDAKKAEIAGLENDLNELQNNLEAVTQSNIDRINEQIIETKEQYKSLKEERDKILAENRYGENTDEVVAALDEQLKGLAQEGYFEIDGEMNIVNEDEVREEIESEPIEINAEGNFEEFKGQAKDSVDIVQKLLNENSQGVPIKINLDSDSVFDIDTQIAGIMSSLDKLRNEDGTINIEAEGAQDVINVLLALIAKKQELNEPVIMTADTSNVDANVSSVIGKLQEFQNAYNELERLNTLKSAGVDVDTSAAQEKLNGLASEISSFDGKQAEILATLNVDPTSIESIKSTISSIGASDLANVGVTVEAKTEGKTDVEALSSAIEKVQGKTVSVSASVSGTSSVRDLSNAISGLKNKTVTVTTKRVEEKASKASGTMLSPAHAEGTSNSISAYAGGNVAIQKDEKALVNELKKPESIVRDGVWSIIPGGAHIEQLKKGDIIFNGEQTEQLLKHGKIAGHGKAYANGTVPDGSIASTLASAYAGGSGGGSFQGGAATGTDKKKPSSSNSNSSSNKKSSNKKSSNSSSSTDDAKEFEEALDWIEIKIDRLERKIKSLDRIAGSAFETYATRSKALAEQMGEVSNEITVQQQAYERYLQQANSISLSDDYKTQVKNGTIDISTITDEDLKKNIDDYKQWYEKALDCKDAVEELTESVKELYQQAFDNIVEEFDNYISLIEHNKNIIDGYIEQDENAGYLVSTKYYDSLIALENQTLNQLTEERDRLIASLNEAVSSGNVKEYSDAWFKIKPRNLFYCGKIPITLICYNVTGNSKRECGMCL
ncbi:hypothetical protein [Blautia hansenii]|uniref:Uncharacterized protein n=1 Tax=Blautia hansenii DSM 20583 TaxID=537007 RepID=C9L799_BLAHA|nr:hypothetical protein [Blautia hansenii]EEX22293.1 hypothetical protein BLAHAN_05261 [Blautia hansenii DSM 20583]UWO09678.1 hypothetical protein NQ538_10370 [Blautia hansenii DSM 20583]